ncbi:MAG TPA: type II toxin-antitoxin system RelE/ParE family toxin [Sphingomicrobium sp.]|nr:type II toxin-antitoxin system RelE/ParE family toxin [Sphingomicrobium sp.]
MARGRFEVQLTRGAEGDLESIFEYLAENDSVEQATKLLESFLSKVQTLERYPSRGSIPKELETLGIREFRQLLLKPYRLIYRVMEDKVFVMLIADGRRDMQALLERRLLGGG